METPSPSSDSESLEGIAMRLMWIRIAMTTLLALPFFAAIAVAQQEVAPDHFDGGDYRLQPRHESNRAARLLRSRTGRARQKHGTQSRVYRTPKGRLRARALV